MNQPIVSRAWRLLRWGSLAVLIPVLWACNDRSFEAPAPRSQSTFLDTFQETINRKLDLLFMIDDSSSMNSAQTNLKNNFATFMDVLNTLPAGLPDLHLAVITSDMGAGNGIDIGECGSDTANPAGDGGLFKIAPTEGCASVGLTDPTARFLIDSGGANPQTNFGSQDIATVFGCIAVTGDQGCGFEHQLASVVHALGADNFDAMGNPQPPPENDGFLRRDAYLGIVLVTNEDDCSGPPGDVLFNPASNDLNSMYGPTENFSCNEWGHLCSLNGGPLARPSRFAPNNLATDTVTYSAAGGPDNCVSAESQGLLSPVGKGGFADAIKQLKPDPDKQILVAALAGPTTEYTVTWQDSPTAPGQLWPVIKHSCGSDSSTTSFADPAVRIQQFVEEFGPNGLVDTFCQANYGPSLDTIAKKLGALLAPQCIAGTVATRPNSTTFDCTVTDVVTSAADPSKQIQTVVPSCADTAGAVPCWTLDAGTGPTPGNGCAPTEHLLNIMRGGAMPATSTTASVNCSICTPGYLDPAVGCP